jgi:beta-lactamase regulating signal transducer with metallopeptidase domain
MNAAAKTLVESLAMMGAQGTLVAVVALLIVRGGRLRPGWQAAVWLVVLIKFALPWGPALPWSLADALAALRHHGDAGAPIAAAPADGPILASHVSGAWTIAAIAWLTGSSIVVARALITQRRVVRAARRAAPAPRWAQALLASFTRRPPRLVVGDPAIGPHVVGLFRPIIVVPPALLAESALLCPALLHELAHVRRRDALARLVQIVAGAMFFFWPVVRLASRRLDLSREAACDAWALEVSEVSRPAYARLLVRMAQLPIAAAGHAMGAAHGLDARVAAVLGPPVHRRLGALHAAALAGWIAMALGGARTAAARGEHATCKYTPALAAAVRQAHPEADLDGDGVLSRDEACAFQAELRRRVEPAGADLVSRATAAVGTAGAVAPLPELDASLLSEPLCCNCDRGAEDSAPGAPWIEKHSDTCLSDQGVSR